MLYALLGPFLAYDVQGEVIAELAPRQRQLLALLLLNANIVLHRDRLIDLLWNGRPPDSARRNLTTYVARLRRLLSPREPENSALGTVGSGYVLSAPSASVDVEQFNHLTMQGRTARDNRDYHNAAELLEDALRLWRGGRPAAVPRSGRGKSGGCGLRRGGRARGR
ncbi:winged helix-turn-helix domain-containing protein [Microbispora sp. NBC_01389]|uniref:AfsR/SARP family transcriptional regulator n=1 Tax=Microbispora sp. NBC_01389 TaxID=2903584 RepID=UPI00324642BB